MRAIAGVARSYKGHSRSANAGNHDFRRGELCGQGPLLPKAIASRSGF
ncbi:hypothetical protein ACNFIA_28165 [Pseudomonas sp. NY15437]